VRRSAIGLLVLVAAVAACRGGIPETPFEHLGEAREIAATMRVEMAKAAEASDQAVMADTDEASIAFARDADRAKENVRGGAAALAPLLKRLDLPGEARSLDEFRARFEEYVKVDRGVLELAVENTNLKAQRLSFGPVRQAADAFRDALDASVKALPDKERCRGDRLVAQAVLAVRDIQVLQAPHIAEAEDAVMSHLEKDMAGREASARASLAALGAVVGAAGQARLAEARGALERFSASSRELVALSRRNSNVRSLEIALHQKPALTAACDSSLGALVAGLGRVGASATK
jgi:hypothetical protein